MSVREGVKDEGLNLGKTHEEAELDHEGQGQQNKGPKWTGYHRRGNHQD